MRLAIFDVILCLFLPIADDNARRRIRLFFDAVLTVHEKTTFFFSYKSLPLFKPSSSGVGFYDSVRDNSLFMYRNRCLFIRFMHVLLTLKNPAWFGRAQDNKQHLLSTRRHRQLYHNESFFYFNTWARIKY